MDRNDMLDSLSGDVTPINELDGDISSQGEVEGDIEADGQVEGDVEIAKAYYNKMTINGHELKGDMLSPELDIEVLKDDLTATRTVGGVNSGDEYEQGTMLETIIRDMLNPIDYPRLINPSAVVVATGDKLLEKGSTLSTVVSISFNRGLINPAYGTNGYRSGPATMYYLNGGPGQANNSFFYTITEQDNTLQGTVDYSAGEQPKNSIGENYDSPLPAGTVNSPIVTYEFVNALWSNTGNIQTIAKLPLVSKSAGVKEFVFPEQTVSNPEVFDVPATWNVSTIEVLNTLSGAWEDVAGEFDISNTVHDDAGGTSTAYKRYTDNRGYSAGSRTIRIKWG